MFIRHSDVISWSGARESQQAGVYRTLHITCNISAGVVQALNTMCHPFHVMRILTQIVKTSKIAYYVVTRKEYGSKLIFKEKNFYLGLFRANMPSITRSRLKYQDILKFPSYSVVLTQQPSLPSVSNRRTNCRCFVIKFHTS